METSVSNSGSGGGSFPWEKAAVRIENPFTFKVGQVFTGVGVGCGLGIGVGRPLNLGAIPVLNQVMSAASGATYAFSGIGRHVNHSLKKIGAKNIEAGIGCGVGFGHGFGVGFAVKPGVIHQLQTCLFQAMGKMMMKLGEGPNLSLGQNILPPSVQSATKTVVTQSSQQSPMGNFVQLGGVTENLSPGLPQLRDLMKGSTNENVAPQASSVKSFSTRTEKVLGNFLQSPVLRDDTEIIETEGGKAEYEDRMLRMVLKHQQVIEELMEENEKLQRILLQDLKVSPEKLQPKALRYPCSDCFECRRRQRRR